MKRLIYAPAPANNPLKGLVPYAGSVQSDFPHSMEFQYLPVGAVATGVGRFDWSPLEELLEQVAGRRHQAVFRFYLEYPGRNDGIPAFLTKAGLKVHRWQNTNTQPFPPMPVETPDYEDAGLRRLLRDFIGEMGRRYDGDPRIGFITAGLLGTWGEWHDYPRNELFASKAVQTEVMDAYERAFRRTPILLRYPTGMGNPSAAPNAHRRFGYHDDSFAWATRETGRSEDDWFFLPALRKAGPEAQAKWKTRPIGGEIRPEAWGRVFDANPDRKEIQDFERCVAETHVTWLMDTGMFQNGNPPERRRRAEAQTRKMGYEFYVQSVDFAPRHDSVVVITEAVNRGVAPFYLDWQIEYRLRGIRVPGAERIHRTTPGERLTGILPGEPPRRGEERLPFSGLPSGRYVVSLRIVNPLKNGLPVFFANVENDLESPGWLRLGEVTLLAR